MSTENVIECQCCGDEVEEDQVSVDTDLNEPVCPACLVQLRWACAQLRRRTTNGVSLTGIHGPQENCIPWNPKPAEGAYQKWLVSKKRRRF